MARQAEQFAGQAYQLPGKTCVWIKATSAQTLRPSVRFVPPGQRCGQTIEALRLQTERTTNVFERTFRAVADHGGSQGGAFTAVFVIDVLQHLFASLVLKVDVDIGRLVAFLGNEALEQQLLF